MPIVLTASVGRMGGVNRPPDVLQVQQALNRRSPAEGGPVKKLDEDSICGPKTIDTIQRFQLKHFGWPGADGRVDVDGPTHRKLNDYEPVIAPPPPEIEATSESFSFRFNGDIKPRDVEWRIRITDEANEKPAIYRLEQWIDWDPEKRQRDWGKFYPVSLDAPMSVKGFDGARFAYRSTLIYDKTKTIFEEETWVNVMALLLPHETQQRSFMGTPVKIWDCWNDKQKSDRKQGLVKHEVRGVLRLIGED